MPRILSYSLIIVVVLACAGAFLQLTTVHRNEAVSGAEIRSRMESAARLVLQKETSALRAQLASAAFDKYLVAGIEELDGYAVMKALQNLCREGGYSSCRVFDADGEFLADQSVSSDADQADGETTTQAIAVTVADKDKLYSQITSTDENIFVSAQGPVQGSSGRIGWIELQRPLGRAFCDDIAATAGLTAGVTTSAGRLVCSSADNELASVLAQNIAAAPMTAGSMREIGSLSFLASEFRSDGPEGVDFLIFGEQIWRPAAQSGAIDGRMLAVVLVLVLIATVMVIAHVRRTWRRPVRATLRQLSTYDFTRAHESPEWADKPFVINPDGPPEFREMVQAFNNLIKKASAELSAMQQEKKLTDARLAKVAELLRIGDGAFRMFLEKTRAFDETCTGLLAALEAGGDPQQIAGQLLRHTYNIKSNARLFNFRHVDQPAHELEEFLISVLRHAAPDRSFAVMTKQLVARISAEVEGYLELRTRILPETGSEEAVHWRDRMRASWIVSVTGRLFSWLKNPVRDPLVASRLHSEFRSVVSSVGKEDLQEYVRRFDRMLASMGKVHGKRLRPLEVTGNYLHFSHEIMQNLNDVFLHCLRNAFDHGIEPPARREAVGKEPAATIQIESNFYSGICSIVLRDDGRGIDLDQLRSIAVERRLCSVAEVRTLSDRQLMDILFRTGFTTASFVSDTSGRGVGMDTVRQILRSMGGEVWVESEPGEGTAVHMHFPVKESGHGSGLGLFNPVVELEHLTAVAGAVAPGLRVSVQAPHWLRQKALIVCDRYLFNESLKTVVREAAANGARSLSLELDHLHEDNTCSLEAYVLRLKISGGDRSPVLDTGFETGLFAMLTEAGIILNDDKAGEGVFELRLTGAAGAWFGARTVTAAVPDSLKESLSDLFISVAEKRFPSVRVRVFGFSELEGRVAVDQGSIIVLDEAALSDDHCARLVEAVDSPSSVVMICDDMETLNRERLFALARHPQIVEDMLDAETAAANIEMCLERNLSRLAQESAGVAGLEAA